MKTLELSQMENTQAGWSWGGGAVGAGSAIMAGGWEAAAAGWIGVAILGGVGCVFGGLAA